MDNSTGLIAIILVEGSSSHILSFPLAGHPLIAHSILLAKSCPEIMRTFVVTKDPNISPIIQNYLGKEDRVLNFPATSDDSHAIKMLINEIEKTEKESFQYALYLNPAMPFRIAENVMECFQRLILNSVADAIVGVSSLEEEVTGQDFFYESEGYLRPVESSSGGVSLKRRYLKTDNLQMFRLENLNYYKNFNEANLLPYELNPISTISVKCFDDIEKMNLIVESDKTLLPWL